MRVNQMWCEILTIKGTWREVADSARTTVGMEPGDGVVSPIWKKSMLLSEHSPIRQLIIKAKWHDIAYFVHAHLVRHKIGTEWWVKSSRPDLTGKERGSQEDPVDMEGDLNVQAIINISRRRLCNKAANETQVAWSDFLHKLKYEEPEIVSVCVPECVYRGYCYERRSCGYFKTETFQKELAEYRKGINDE